MKRTRLRSVSAKGRARLVILSSQRFKVLVRAAGRCEVCWEYEGLLMEVHHVVKRSHARNDELDNLIGLCASCHRKTDAPYRLGRLVIRPLGGERFDWRIVIAPNKWEATA